MKEYLVEISGRFTASGIYKAENEEEAKELATTELFNIDPMCLTVDFEQSDIEAY